MTERILVAVDDSPAGLAAARAAVAMARTCGTGLRLISVVADSDVAAAITAAVTAGGEARPTERRLASGLALLDHVQALAGRAGVSAEPVQRYGEPAHEILQLAREWPADLIVIGRGGRSGPGRAFVGRETRIVLEFAEQPVLVVPVPPRDVRQPTQDQST